MPRVINLRHRSDQTVDYVHLIEQRKLNCNVGQIDFRKFSFWLRRKF